MSAAPPPEAWPDVVSREEWTAARRALLAEEKALTRQHDRVAAARRRLPMVAVTESYLFEGPDGPLTLRDLFGPHQSLIIGHFMFHPEWERGCSACTWFADEMEEGRLRHLAEDGTAFAYVSRAPYAKIAAYRAERGWTFPWVSSHGTRFNHDFGVTLDRSTGDTAYNYAPSEVLEAKGFVLPDEGSVEVPGFSFFVRRGEEIFHTYSTYARGSEGFGGSHYMLDHSVWGRRQDFEDSPEGWPQRPTYG